MKYSFRIGGPSEPAGIFVAMNNVRKEAVVTREAENLIVGAGISGGALATALGRCAIAVLVLEKPGVHQDRVRGDFLAAWGVDEGEAPMAAIEQIRNGK
ncbi:MAG: hypothetical protein J2P53_10730 [Bradyrhizobiaceae bacterium]|nr:hypothetical protein [Bradyrhizobiaceae bacterium]